MAIEVQVVAAVVDSEPEVPGSQGILLKAAASQAILAPEGASLADCAAIAKAKMETMLSENRAEIVQQLTEMERMP